jgi:hypothetical protein
MARRRKHAVRKGHGSMCKICGRNCGKGAALSTHIKGAHGVDYGDYKKCFEGEVATVIADTWDDNVATSGGKTVMTHVLVRRFVGDPGPRGATR